MENDLTGDSARTAASLKTWKKYLNHLDANNINEIERTKYHIESLQAFEDGCGSEHLACLLNFSNVEEMITKIKKDAQEILKNV